METTWVLSLAHCGTEVSWEQHVDLASEQGDLVGAMHVVVMFTHPDSVLFRIDPNAPRASLCSGGNIWEVTVPPSERFCERSIQHVASRKVVGKVPPGMVAACVGHNGVTACSPRIEKPRGQKKVV